MRFDLGCRAVMTLPPFFFVTASEEGLYRYFSLLIEKVGSDALTICLYHIPQYAGIGFTPALAARLNEAFPEVVTALKDSSGNWDNTRAVIEAAPRHIRLSRQRRRNAGGDGPGRRRLHLGQLQFQCGGDSQAL